MVGDMTFVSMVMVSPSPTRRASVCVCVCAFPCSCVCVMAFLSINGQAPFISMGGGGPFIDTVKYYSKAAAVEDARLHAAVSS